jgi:hypothetical protein
MSNYIPIYQNGNHPSKVVAVLFLSVLRVQTSMDTPVQQTQQRKMPLQS